MIEEEMGVLLETFKSTSVLLLSHDEKGLFKNQHYCDILRFDKEMRDCN